MNPDNALLLIAGLMVAAVPWAFYIGVKLTSIDNKVAKIDEHETRLDDHGTRIVKLETARSIHP